MALDYSQSCLRKGESSCRDCTINLRNSLTLTLGTRRSPPPPPPPSGPRPASSRRRGLRSRSPGPRPPVREFANGFWKINELLNSTQQTRMRQFCVEIAPPFIRRNIDAALLREHSVRRICAHYKGLQICANSTHALTYASNLRKKNN